MFLVIESCYSDKLAHVQILINCRYSVAQMCTCEDTLAHDLGVPCLDDVTNVAIFQCILRKKGFKSPMFANCPPLIHFHVYYPSTLLVCCSCVFKAARCNIHYVTKTMLYTEQLVLYLELHLLISY